jgi:hypothetical protein
VYAAIATEPGQPDKRNEDWAGVSPTVAVLLDGLSSASGAESGCRHGTPWFVEQLGTRLLAAAGDAACELTAALRTAIEAVAGLHRDTCDLADPGAPSTTVAILRLQPHSDIVEYLVLADARVVLETGSGVQTIIDDRVDRVAGHAQQAVFRQPIGTVEHRRAVADLIAIQQPLRNQPDGYWIAAADPRAADHAITGALPSDDVRQAALLSDGASRIVDVFEQMDWCEALAVIRTSGPHHFIRRVRVVERTDPDGRRWPRFKAADDATVVYATWQRDLDMGSGLPGHQ